jgi:recombination protein RecT
MSDTTKGAPQAPTIKQFAPITKVKTLQELFDHPGLRSRMEATLPQHLNADRMLRTLMNAALKTPGLTKASPLSMLGAAMTVAYLGLEPNTPLQQIHLVPFDVTKWNAKTKEREYIRTDITPIIGYQGYIELIARGGKIKGVADCQVVWAGDHLVYEHGSNHTFSHVPKHAPRTANAEPEYAYMYVEFPDGGEYVELMTRADVLTIRGRSQGYRAAVAAHDNAVKKGWDPNRSPAYSEAPWVKWPIPMWRKTPLRAGQKWIPKSAELAVAIAMDEAGDEGRVRFDNIMEAEAVSEGVWEVPSGEVDPDEQVPEQPQDSPTTTPRSAAATTTTAGASSVDQGPSQQNPKAAAGSQRPAKALPPPVSDGPPAGQFPDDAPPAAQESRTAPPRTEGPEAGAQTPGPATPSASQGTAAFEGYLSDETGEIIEGPIADPVVWGDRLAKLLSEADAADREAIWDSNVETIGGLDTHPKVGPALAALHAAVFASESAEEGGTAEASVPSTTYTVVELTENRGKPDWKSYLAGAGGFYELLAGAPAGHLDAWLAAQMPTLLRSGMPQQLLVRKKVLERCQALGIDPVPSMDPLGRGEPLPAAATPAQASSATADNANAAGQRQWAPELQKDAKLVEDRLLDLRQVLKERGRAEAVMFGQRNIGVTGLVDRLTREGQGIPGKLELLAYFNAEAKRIVEGK